MVKQMEGFNEYRKLSASRGLGCRRVDIPVSAQIRNGSTLSFNKHLAYDGSNEGLVIPFEQIP